MATRLARPARTPTNQSREANQLLVDKAPAKRGRPPGKTPPKTAAERKQAQRVRQAREGVTVLQVTLDAAWVPVLDQLRGEKTRDGYLSELVVAVLARRSR